MYLTTTEEVIRLAYSLYPKGQPYSDIDTEYFKTEQFIRLNDEVKKGYKKYVDTWQAFLFELNKEKGFDIGEIGLDTRCERAFRIAITFLRNDIYYKHMVLYVSKIVPYYCFLFHERNENGMVYNEKEKTITWGYNFFYQVSDPYLLKGISIIKNYLSNDFTTFKEFPCNLIETVISDIEFEDNGIVDSDQSGIFYHPFTAFNAFFSSHQHF